MYINNRVYEIYKDDAIFPESLKKIKGCPKKILALGNLNLFNENSISIIGSRNSTEYGEKMTKLITEDLVKNDIVIVSGLAKGIDSVAHKTCINSGGKTIAVLGSGFKNIFPKENEKLFYQIIDQGGLLLSEFPIDYPVQAKNFPKRNRIISGLSLGTVVVEATYRSGTSITARFARCQGKKVFCIPNSVGNKNSCGTINLLKDGAKLVTSGKDILENLNLKIKAEVSKKQNKQIRILDKTSKIILDCINSYNIIDAEGIAINSNLEISEVNQLLTMMEIDGIIESVNGNKYKVSDGYNE